MDDKMLAEAAQRRLSSMSTDRPGGWREERSPDGRITMYVSPKGERLSKSEFFSMYPQGTGTGASVAGGMMRDVMSGRSQVGMPEQENVKVGVVLQPVTYGSGSFHAKQAFRDTIRRQADELTENLKSLERSANKGDERIAGIAEQARENLSALRSLESTLRRNQATSLRHHQEDLKSGYLREPDASDMKLYEQAKLRDKPIPFPDKK